MNDASKHVVWVLGLLGSITLGDWNEIAGIACATAGFIAACLSIYSFFEKRRRKAAEQRAEDGGQRAEDGGQRAGRRHHHLWLWILLGLACLQASAQGNGTSGTNGTNGAQVAAQSVWAVVVAEDARKLVFDFLSGFSLPGCFQALFLAYLAAKGLRNYTALGRSAGWAGVILRLINLEARLLTPSPTGQRSEDGGQRSGGTPGGGTEPTDQGEDRRWKIEDGGKPETTRLQTTDN